MLETSSSTLDLWDAATSAPRDGRGVYVAVSGNTAAGKSTLISETAQQATAAGLPAIGVSERAFHHPYLTRMFADPSRYAFSIQINFMLQRHLVLLRQLELGRLVIIERSHFDDALFLREHAEAGHVRPDEAAAYENLARVLHARIPAPDVLVLMNPSPAVSLARLSHAERSGERPSEFPSEAAKVAWVDRWHALYERLHEQYQRDAGAPGRLENTRLMRLDPEASTAANAATVLAEMARQLARSSHPAGGCGRSR